MRGSLRGIPPILPTLSDDPKTPEETAVEESEGEATRGGRRGGGGMKLKTPFNMTPTFGGS